MEGCATSAHNVSCKASEEGASQFSNSKMDKEKEVVNLITKTLTEVCYSDRYVEGSLSLFSTSNPIKYDVNQTDISDFTLDQLTENNPHNTELIPTYEVHNFDFDKENKMDADYVSDERALDKNCKVQLEEEDIFSVNFDCSDDVLTSTSGYLQNIAQLI